MGPEVQPPVALADGGIETALIDRLGQELPEFAAFALLDTAPGRLALREYYLPFLEIAARERRPIVLDTPTWRANPDWVRRLGYAPGRVESANREAVRLLQDLIVERGIVSDSVVNGCVGPRYDDFDAAQRADPAAWQAYHSRQISALAEAGADRITSVTTLDAAEGIGVVRAAVEHGLPAAVSFTVDADGRLADGTELIDGIAAVDEATDGAALGFLVNCAHAVEVRTAATEGSDARRAANLLARIIGLRLNAARRGDDGPGDPPGEFARRVVALTGQLPSVRLLGGCCGTDAPHIAALARELAAEETSER
ncbi:homocysteine S-methyltransferase family protein [Leucobacter weissii]|uniref:Homocysteine S-methyltransferase family protein n=1 Tax=Leucobacter weissii TaxID=1983706 RepID=A0A939SAT6_9MICO|nr:homocysteine S-methyltransferase family protein [Leucobacter weissii]MBO1900733.1 homocysteine S-methyltransferase family protein [Leucobacter weissii]